MTANKDTAAELKRLRERVEGAGAELTKAQDDYMTIELDPLPSHMSMPGDGPFMHFKLEHIATAHALLDGLSMVRGPVVEIVHDNNVEISCGSKCQLDPRTCGYSVKGRFLQHLPGSDCPINTMPLADDEEYFIGKRKKIREVPDEPE